MTVQQIADRLVDLCRQGKYDVAQKELYSNDAVSLEPEGSPALQTVKGLESIIAKGHQFQSAVQEVHSNTVSDPVVAGEHFAVATALDMTLAGVGRVMMEELAVYQVKNEKVIREQFFYRV